MCTLRVALQETQLDDAKQYLWNEILFLIFIHYWYWCTGPLTEAGRWIIIELFL